MLSVSENNLKFKEFLESYRTYIIIFSQRKPVKTFLCQYYLLMQDFKKAVLFSTKYIFD